MLVPLRSTPVPLKVMLSVVVACLEIVCVEEATTKDAWEQRKTGTHVRRQADIQRDEEAHNGIENLSTHPH
jgi:hypothetical protein